MRWSKFRHLFLCGYCVVFRIVVHLCYQLTIKQVFIIMENYKIGIEKKTIFFGERTIGSSFPKDFSEIPLKRENETRFENGDEFTQDGYSFTFDETASHNGWWASKPGFRGICRVEIS